MSVISGVEQRAEADIHALAELSPSVDRVRSINFSDIGTEVAEIAKGGVEVTKESVISILTKLFPTENAQFSTDAENTVATIKKFKEAFEKPPSDNPDFIGPEETLLAEGETIVVNTEGSGFLWTSVSDAMRESITSARKLYQPEIILGDSYELPIHVKNVPEADNDSSVFDSTKILGAAVLVGARFLIRDNGQPVTKYEDYDVVTGVTGIIMNGGTPFTPPLFMNWDSDEYFVEQRVLGVNPCAMRALSSLSNEAEVLKLFSDGGFALNPGKGTQLFIIDYDILTESSRTLRYSSAYVPAPVVALEFNERSKKFSPVAIVLDRAAPKPVAVGASTLPKWSYAKSFVRAADFSVHELGSHLTLTHLVEEVVALATYRTLPKEHPVYQLLAPHFFKTLPLNSSARSLLVPKFIAGFNGLFGGAGLVPFTIAQCWALVTQIYKSWDFVAHYARNDLVARGVDKLPPQSYPFGETARTVWDTTKEYVTAVIRAMNTTEVPLVCRDVLLQEWVKLLRDKAWMPSFPDIKTDAELIDALTMIIYNASHQHAAVNYFQSKYMSFGPTGTSHVFPYSGNIDTMTANALPACLARPVTAGAVAAIVNLLSVPPSPEETLGGFQTAELLADTGAPVGSRNFAAAHYVVSPIQGLRTQFQKLLAGRLAAVDRSLSGFLGLGTPTHLKMDLLAQSVLI